LPFVQAITVQLLRGIASKDVSGELERCILALATVPFLSGYVVRSPMPPSGCSAGFLRKESLPPRLYEFCGLKRFFFAAGLALCGG
jgi:hypothetical protein